MEHQGTRIETVVTDEDGNETIEVTWENPPSITGPFYDESVTDEDRLADAWDEVRAIRNHELRQMDIYQLAIPYSLLDNTQQAQLQIYRQALLDLPSAYSTPEEALLNMPTKPDWMN